MKRNKPKIKPKRNIEIPFILKIKKKNTKKIVINLVFRIVYIIFDTINKELLNNRQCQRKDRILISAIVGYLK